MRPVGARSMTPLGGAMLLGALTAAMLATGTAQARSPVDTALAAILAQLPPAPPPPQPDQTVAPSDAAAPDAPASATAPPPRHAKGDPLEKLNRRLYRGQVSFDRKFFRPIAFAYKAIFPKPIRTAFRHILSNISEPIVFLNDMLQLRPKRAARTFGRFMLNSTIGIGGIIDVAKGENLPHRNNGFGNTLARYGVGPGPYLFLPLIGPTTLRDIFGSQADALVYPVAIGRPFSQLEYQVPTFVVAGLDLRVESDAQLKALLDGAADPYATLRSVYMQNRAAEIADVKGETVALDDPLVDPEATPDGAAPAAGDAADPLADPASADAATAESPAEPDAVAPPPASSADAPPVQPDPAMTGASQPEPLQGEPKIVSFFTP